MWFYIKFIYLITCFFNLLIFVNSVFKYLLIKGSKSKKENQIDTNIDVGNFHLFLGHNSINQKKVYIPEKGLYQNILITGTIGSRKNRFLYVSHFTSIN